MKGNIIESEIKRIIPHLKNLDKEGLEKVKKELKELGKMIEKIIEK